MLNKIIGNKKPNIVFIMTDDQGEWALGCSGNTELKTPTIDNLAKEGIRFANYFCVSPVCSPARASVLTGSIPSQNGVQDWIREGNAKENAIDYLEGLTAYTDILATNGYTCGISGKWHLGNSFEPQHSFSHWYVHQKGGGNYYNAPMVRNGIAVEEPEYITNLITDDAISFIEEQAGGENPFYISIHYTAPHSPWDEHPKKYIDMYNKHPLKLIPQTGIHHPDAVCRYTKEDQEESLKGYYASLTAVDDQVTKIISVLEEYNILENTLIVFTSDNGFNCGQHGIWGKGNGTFSLNMYDTSIKVPMIFYHKDHISGGRVVDELLSHYDFMPTLLEYIGIRYDEDKRAPGKSFAQILTNDSYFDFNNSIFVYDEYGPTRMVRSKEFKYIHRYPYGPNEFYDLVADKNENYNLINDVSMKENIEALRLQLYTWFEKYVDPRIDATKEPVLGNGQVARPGIFSKGEIAFKQNREIQYNSKTDPGDSQIEIDLRINRKKSRKNI